VKKSYTQSFLSNLKSEYKSEKRINLASSIIKNKKKNDIFVTKKIRQSACATAILREPPSKQIKENPSENETLEKKLHISVEDLKPKHF
jgi:hypothetical protein